MPRMSFIAADLLTTKLSRSHRSGASVALAKPPSEPRFSPIADLAEARIAAQLSASLDADAPGLDDQAEALGRAARVGPHPCLLTLGPGALAAPETSVERALVAMERAGVRGSRVAWIAPVHRGFAASALRALGEAARRAGLRLVLSGDARSLATALATSALRPYALLSQVPRGLVGAEAAQERELLVALATAAEHRGAELCLRGVQSFDEMVEAAAVGARWVEGPALGRASTRPAALGACRHALLRAAWARRPRGVDVLAALRERELEARATLANLRADPDARELAELAEAWPKRLGECRARLLEASAQVRVAAERLRHCDRRLEASMRNLAAGARGELEHGLGVEDYEMARAAVPVAEAEKRQATSEARAVLRETSLAREALRAALDATATRLGLGERWSSELFASERGRAAVG